MNNTKDFKQNYIFNAKKVLQIINKEKEDMKNNNTGKKEEKNCN